jgi:hypothetical protein
VIDTITGDYQINTIVFIGNLRVLHFFPFATKKSANACLPRPTLQKAIFLQDARLTAIASLKRLLRQKKYF